MLRIRRYGLVVLVVLPVGCGLYGEGGFSGKNPLPAPRFIENVDEACEDVNETLDDETASLRPEAPADDATDDAIGDLRDGIDELVEELPDHYGPEELEQQRDTYVEVLEQADDELKDARDALKDEDDKAFRQHLATAMEALTGGEKSMRTAGFRVCGVPRPAE
jgi:hypothetical protein